LIAPKVIADHDTNDTSVYTGGLRKERGVCSQIDGCFAKENIQQENDRDHHKKTDYDECEGGPNPLHKQCPLVGTTSTIINPPCLRSFRAHGVGVVISETPAGVGLVETKVTGSCKRVIADSISQTLQAQISRAPPVEVPRLLPEP